MARLLFTTTTFDLGNFRERATVEAAGFELILNPFRARLTESQVAGLLDERVVGIVAGVEPLTRTVLRSAPSLRVIARCGAGLDNVDLDAASELGISVFSTPDAPSRAVAELAVAHLMSLARRVAECDRAIRAGRWQPLKGPLIANQTIGIVGFGRIGRKVAQILSAFGATLLTCDAAPVKNAAGLVQVVSLMDLLARSDIVTLHVPLDDSTRDMIGAEAIARMKPGALIVNVSRGGLIDEDALLGALRTGQLGGAAIDCFDKEPYSGPLIECENVQLSAHMGSYARETRALMEAEACDALVNGLKRHALL